MVKVYTYLDPSLVAFLDVDTRDDALEKLVDLLHSFHKIEDRDAFLHAIMEREKIVSTGIGSSVAIPHAKLTGFDEFFIAIGILQRGVDWHAMDHAPVRLVFMIGGPDDKQTEYLQLLSALTIAIKDDERRKALLKENSAEKIIELFKKF